MADDFGTRVLRQVLRTSRGRALLVAHFFAAFGAVSAVLLYGVPFGAPGVVAVVAVAAGAAWGLVRIYPPKRIYRDLEGSRITIRVGDLLAEPADLVIGCGDTFDLDSGLLNGLYQGDATRLDEELDVALSGVVPTSVETREAKPEGRLRRYAIGTVAVVGAPERKVYCLACKRTGDQGSLDDLWLGLVRLWGAIDGSERVAVPVLGAGGDTGSLIKMIALSFATRPACRELVVVVPPGETVDMLELREFLTAL